MMRLILLVVLAVTLPTTLTLAQGTKDPANFGNVSNSNARPAQVSGPSRPTAIMNAPNNILPAGTAIQRVYRDGKLQTIVR
jgi:hypothetical protein